MIDQDLEFHNVDHLERVSGMEGLRLERFPARFKQELGIPENHNAQFRAKRVHGCEIRFVTEALYFEVCLTAVETDIDIVIYCGDMMHSKHTLKAGVNMLVPFEKEEFEKRVRSLLWAVKEKSPARNVFVIDIFTNRSPILKNHEDNQYRHYGCFKEVIKKLVEETADDRIVHIDGAKVAEDLTYLSTDLLHPSDQGHIRMGIKLADIMKKYE